MTVAQAVTVNVLNGYFSWTDKCLFLPGFHSKQPERVTLKCNGASSESTDFRRIENLVSIRYP
jgi:hypothetical protein